MKKVTIYFKSGNKLSFKCKEFTFKSDTNGTNQSINIIGIELYQVMIDASQIESYTVKKCFSWNLKSL